MRRAQFFALEEISVLLVFLWFCEPIFLVLRIGLAGWFYFVSSFMLTYYPMTMNFSVWYASSGLFAVAMLLLLAGRRYLKGSCWMSKEVVIIRTDGREAKAEEYARRAFAGLCAAREQSFRNMVIYSLNLHQVE